MLVQINYYKARLAALGRSQLDVVAELSVRGLHVCPSALSVALRVIHPSPYQQRIRDASDSIITEWEKQQRRLKSDESASNA